MSAKPIVLKDGTAITIRPARVDDALALFEMYQRLSPDSLYLRYLHAYTPTLAEMERICQIGENEGIALVATTPSPQERVVGLAQCLIEDPHRPETAEFAILIEDIFQGLGLGTRLFRYLSQQALEHGIHTLNAYLDTANYRMMRLIRKGDCPYERKIAYSTHEVHIELDPVCVLTATSEPATR